MNIFLKAKTYLKFSCFQNCCVTDGDTCISNFFDASLYLSGLKLQVQEAKMEDLFWYF